MQLLQPPTNAPGNRRAKATLFAVAMIVVALLSVIVLSPIASSPDTYKGAYAKLEEKRNNVISLTTAATAASIAITTFGPDDSGTPVADQLMAIAKDFAFVLAAIVLEKYLITIMGGVMFGGVVPLCCLIGAVTAFMASDDTKRASLRAGALKLLLLGLVLFLTIPVSVSIASAIDGAYQPSIDAVNEQTGTFDAATEAAADKDASATKTNVSKDEERDGGLFEQLTQIGGGVVDSVSSAVSGAAGTVLGVVDAARDMVGDLIELFGVMVATSILIPILVPVVMYLALKMLFGQELSQAATKVVLVTANEGKASATPLPAAAVEAPEEAQGEREA